VDESDHPAAPIGAPCRLTWWGHPVLTGLTLPARRQTQPGAPVRARGRRAGRVPRGSRAPGTRSARTAKVLPVPIKLERLSEASIKRFVRFERPTGAGPPEDEDEPEFAGLQITSIEDLYDRISQVLDAIPLSDAELFIGPLNAQVDGNLLHVNWPRPGALGGIWDVTLFDIADPRDGAPRDRADHRAGEGSPDDSDEDTSQITALAYGLFPLMTQVMRPVAMLLTTLQADKGGGVERAGPGFEITRAITTCRIRRAPFRPVELIAPTPDPTLGLLCSAAPS
jgi:hypothetical protein